MNLCRLLALLSYLVNQEEELETETVITVKDTTL